jgi:hypothetical protein
VTEQEKVIGQAMLTVLAESDQNTMSMKYVLSDLKELGIEQKPGQRLLRFLVELELIEHIRIEEVAGVPELFRITLPGMKAQGKGLAAYLADLDAKEEAKHRAALAAIRGQKVTLVWYLVYGLLTLISLALGIYNLVTS